MKYDYLINKMLFWKNQKEQAIPNSSYYYYCFGIEQGFRLALQEINNKEKNT